MNNQVLFIGGVRGAGKDYVTSRITDVRKFNFFEDILKKEIEESWERTETKIGERIRQLVDEYHRIMIVLHYAAPVESAYNDLEEGIIRDYSDHYSPCLSRNMILSMSRQDIQFSLIYVDSPTEEIISRLKGDEKKRSEKYVKNIELVKTADKVAFEETKMSFFDTGCNVTPFYLLNSKDKDMRRELEAIVAGE